MYPIRCCFFFPYTRPPVYIQIKDRRTAAVLKSNKNEKPADRVIRSPRRIGVPRLLYPEELQNRALKYRSVDENDITHHCGRYVITFRRTHVMLKLRACRHVA